MYVCAHAQLLQSCPTLCDTMDCSLPSSSALTYTLPDLEPVFCSMSISNCCFLTCIEISQEAGQVVWYSHLLNFPQFVVTHAVKGFGVIILLLCKRKILFLGKKLKYGGI